MSDIGRHGYVAVGAGPKPDRCAECYLPEVHAIHRQAGHAAECYPGDGFERPADIRRAAADALAAHEAAIAGRCSHGGHGWDGETCSDIPVQS